MTTSGRTPVFGKALAILATLECPLSGLSFRFVRSVTSTFCKVLHPNSCGSSTGQAISQITMVCNTTS